MILFHLKWRVLVNSERYFLSVPSPDKQSGNLMDIEDVLF